MSMNENEESELIFGWVDKTRYEGDLKWYPVQDKLFWSLELNDIKVLFHALY